VQNVTLELSGKENPARQTELRRPVHVKRVDLTGEQTMDWNRVEGNWKEVKGKVKEKWGKLTDDDLAAINGQRDQLEGRLQQRYGFAKDQARKDVDSWFSSLK
jgi:uncharacterized protein YjbJ (UPF0337 family)